MEGKKDRRDRIYSDRLYVVAEPQGISGFPRPSAPAIVTGRELRRSRRYDWVGRLPMAVDAAEYIIPNRGEPFGWWGRRLTLAQVTEELKRDPFAVAVMVCEATA